MHRSKWLVPAVLAVVVCIVSGCESTSDSSPPQMSGSGDMAPPFGGPDDLRRADALWSTMRGYTGWEAYPELGGWQPGNSPHGKILKYYINSVAARNPETPANGYIIVKENYGDRTSDALMAITVMQKIRGYDPDNQDWFWVKYAPNGDVMTNPKGMKLAGRVAKGMPQGCIACHGNAAGGDYLFIND